VASLAKSFNALGINLYNVGCKIGVFISGTGWLDEYIQEPTLGVVIWKTTGIDVLSCFHGLAIKFIMKTK